LKVEIEVSKWFTAAVQDLHDLTIFLLPEPPPPLPELFSLTFQVEDVQKTRKQTSPAGAPFSHPPQRVF
jgi:hypothetical protein